MSGRGERAASVVQECCQLVGALQACGVVGRRGHAHARMQKVELTSEQKVLIFGVNPAVRLGSVRPGGGAGVQGRRLIATQAWRWRGSAGSSTHSGDVSHFLTAIGRLSKVSRSFY